MVKSHNPHHVGRAPTERGTTDDGEEEKGREEEIHTHGLARTPIVQSEGKQIGVQRRKVGGGEERNESQAIGDRHHAPTRDKHRPPSAPRSVGVVKALSFRRRRRASPCLLTCSHARTHASHLPLLVSPQASPSGRPSRSVGLLSSSSSSYQSPFFEIVVMLLEPPVFVFVVGFPPSTLFFFVVLRQWILRPVRQPCLAPRAARYLRKNIMPAAEILSPNAPPAQIASPPSLACLPC